MGRSWVARASVRRAVLAILLPLSGCAAVPERPAESTLAPVATAGASDVGVEVFEFHDTIASPLEPAGLSSELEPLLAPCRRGDGALARVARRFARRQSEGQPPLDVPEISFALRAEGSPYVWPRAWTLEGGDLLGQASLERLRSWLSSFDDGGERRCGVALAESSERRVLAAVAVDVLADLDPIPVRVRSGAWIDVNATLLVPTQGAKVIVLGPSGAPRAVPTELNGQRVRARFRADRSGAFLVQVLADVSGGPRPVLESILYADVSPPRSYFGDPAPGEPAPGIPAGAEPTAALLSMVNLARDSERRPPLLRDPRLDAVAQRHAEAMRDAQHIAHDAGDGLPPARIEAAGLSVLSTGENVAHASDLPHAHRALWASPSHRENLLQARFDRIGIGVAPDPDGSIWVCEVFADFPESH